MVTKLTLADVERVRLILRGGTVVDWRRMNVSSINDCNDLLRVNEFDPEDERDAARLSDIHRKAVEYLERNFGFTFVADIANAPRTSDLMLQAAGRDPVLRPQACVVLKLMHIIHHIEASELRSVLPISDQILFQMVEKKATRVAQDMKDLGYPIVEFQIGRKPLDSLINKIIRKRQTIRAPIFDRVRLRIVTASVNDIVPMVSYMSRHLFPFNYTVPGESHNSIFDFPAFTKLHPSIEAMVPKLQVDLRFEDEMRPPVNANTSDAFRTVNFVVDVPIRIDSKLLQPASFDTAVLRGVVHVLTEFQIVDQISHARNESGEACHEKYEARQLAKIRERLLHGRMTWHGRDSM